MKRTASRALVVALAAALALSGVAAAKDHPSAKGAAHVAPAGHAAKAGAAVVPSLRTKANTSHPGGVFHVLAVLKAARADRPATIAAIVHFASGDVAVVLSRHGSSSGAAYHADVPVPPTEVAGTVLIDATAVVAGATVQATGSGKIVVADAADAADATETAETAEAPETPDATETAETCTPPTQPHVVIVVDKDESGEDSDADDTAAKCDHGDALVLHLSADAMARLVAFIESLFA